MSVIDKALEKYETANKVAHKLADKTAKLKYTIQFEQEDGEARPIRMRCIVPLTKKTNICLPIVCDATQKEIFDRDKISTLVCSIEIKLFGGELDTPEFHFLAPPGTAKIRTEEYRRTRHLQIFVRDTTGAAKNPTADWDDGFASDAGDEFKEEDQRSWEFRSYPHRDGEFKTISFLHDPAQHIDLIRFMLDEAADQRVDLARCLIDDVATEIARGPALIEEAVARLSEEAPEQVAKEADEQEDPPPPVKKSKRAKPE